MEAPCGSGLEVKPGGGEECGEECQVRRWGVTGKWGRLRFWKGGNCAEGGECPDVGLGGESVRGGGSPGVMVGVL